jgi:LEA14-like dessication related protein
VAAVLASCASTGSKQSGASGPEVELFTETAKVAQHDLGRVVLTLPYQVKNPTAQRATVGGAKWRLEIEGEPVLTGTQAQNAEAGAGGATNGVLTLEAKLATSDQAFNARASKAELRFTVSATFDISQGGEVVPFEAEWHGGLYPPKKPEVTLQAEAARQVGKSLEFNFIVGIANPNPFSVELGGFDYTLFVDQTEVSKDKLAQGHRLDTSSEIQFEVQRFVGREDLFDLAKKILPLSVIPYQLKGTLAFGEIELPVTINGEITFSD